MQYETVTEALRELGNDEALRRINYSVKWNAQIEARAAGRPASTPQEKQP